MMRCYCSYQSFSSLQKILFYCFLHLITHILKLITYLLPNCPNEIMKFYFSWPVFFFSLLTCKSIQSHEILMFFFPKMASRVGRLRNAKLWFRFLYTLKHRFWRYSTQNVWKFCPICILLLSPHKNQVRVLLPTLAGQPKMATFHQNKCMLYNFNCK